MKRVGRKICYFKEIHQVFGVSHAKRDKELQKSKDDQSCLDYYNSLRSKTEFVRFAVNMPRNLLFFL